MQQITIDLTKSVGNIKPMHAVNNGPVYKFSADQRITNLQAFKEAGIPYARTHDSSHYSTYGGEHTVDVHAIFPDFDKNPYDPASYDFTLTDEYMKVIKLADCEPFYRLGSKIEHWPKKYGTLPPKDFKKWAVICEHIIKHLNYGWADGHTMGIKYWEIWNEPDLDRDDSPNKRTWGGTKKQFFELYDIVATHLKECFPELKIGGPALACDINWADEFLAQLKAPLDFFSWHIYAYDPKWVKKATCDVRALLDKHGYKDTESILNEWNYVKGWEGENWVHSLRSEKNIVGAAFVASTMCGCQKSSLDMLMYYDARPCGMNGMFDTYILSEKLKGYYPFYVFNKLYKLGTEVESENAEDIYSIAAKSDNEAAVMVARFNEEGTDEKAKVKIIGAGRVSVEYYLLDANSDLELVREEEFSGDSFTSILNFPATSMYFIKIKKVTE